MPVTALLRHGEVIGGTRFRGRSDDPLTPKGWRQMETALASPRWTQVVTSPLRRCADFARDWGARHQLPVTVEPRLAELDFGAWEGRTPAEVHARWPAALARFWNDPWQHPPPEGEDLTAFSQRVQAAWRDWHSQPGDILFVTHGGVIRMLLAHLHDWPRQRLLEIDVGYGERVDL